MKHGGRKGPTSAPGVLGGSCMDCGVDTITRGEYYALNDSLWRTINPLVIGYLCLECAEDRLGRALHRADFSSAAINKTSAEKCAALAERLQRLQSSASPNNSRQTFRKKPAQSTLGRMSAALLSHRGPDGRVPPETIMRVFRELKEAETPSSKHNRTPRSRR